jgi:hypothetical protein
MDNFDLKKYLVENRLQKEAKNTGLNFDEVEKILNDILEQYLDGIGENTDEDGNIDFGDNVGYKNKEELLSDFITFIENF